MNPKRIDSGAPQAGSRDEDDCALLLSCLLDGEMDSNDCRSLVERLRNDPGACRQWALLNCVGDAMRSPEVAAWHSGDFVSRVSAALEREPTVLAPAALPPRSSARRWLLPGAGAAIAAAVLIAVGLPARQAAAPESFAVSSPAASVASAGAPAQIDRSPRLERYLAAHRELAEPALMLDSTPYLRTSAAVRPLEGR